MAGGDRVMPGAITETSRSMYHFSTLQTKAQHQQQALLGELRGIKPVKIKRLILLATCYLHRHSDLVHLTYGNEQ